MKIYFVGSITGGRNDQGLYIEIVDLLKAHGEVLTEHIASRSLDRMGQQEPDETIYTRDTDWIRQSDVLVAEVTQPSLGVGYEIGLAESLGKPVLCLYRSIDGCRTSPMLIGNTNITTHMYGEPAKLLKIFDEFFNSLETVLQRRKITPHSSSRA